MTKAILFFMLACTAIFTFKYFSDKNPVTQQQFKEAHTEIEFQFDSVKTELSKVYRQTIVLKKYHDSLKKNIKEMTNDLDTLKNGQQTIYNTMTESGGGNLINDIYNLLN